MLNQRGIQPSTFEGGLDDLEGFQAWAEEIKTYLSQADPALYEVLEHTASSKQPLDEESMIKASQDIMKDKHKALRVLQAKIARANLLITAEEEADFPPVDEENPPEADERTEYDFKLELERNQLQVKHEGRQLGCLLVQKTKGEAQLQVRRWLQSSNGWEAWRQLHLLYTTSKRSTHFKLLASLMNPSFDAQPASFLQQFNAWKEQVVRCQQLSGENLPDFIKLTAVVNGLKGNVRHFVLLQLDGDSSFGDLDSLLGKYFKNTYVQRESSLNSVWDKAWRDKQKGKSKGKGKKPNPYYKQKLDKGGEGKGKRRERPGKRQTSQRKRRSFPSPASSQQRQGETTTSKKGTMVRHMLEERAQYPSLLVEHQPAAATAAPTSTSLVLPQPATAMDCPTAAAANESTSFSAKAAASGPQHRPPGNLHQLDTRQPDHVEL